jgi:hypothetical protein
MLSGGETKCALILQVSSHMTYSGGAFLYTKVRVGSMNTSSLEEIVFPDAFHSQRTYRGSHLNTLFADCQINSIKHQLLDGWTQDYYILYT